MSHRPRSKNQPPVPTAAHACSPAFLDTNLTRVCLTSGFAARRADVKGETLF